MLATQTERTIRPARNILGSLRLPGDKSISHRYALLSALASGTTKLTNFSTGADCASSLACAEALGAKVSSLENGVIEITGTGGQFQASAVPLDCGNSGSTMRMLTGLLAATPHAYTLVGDESLSRRPMERVRKPISQMGAEIALTDGHAPITIRGGKLKAIDYATPVPSAQVKTAVLFAGLQAEGTTTVRETVRTRDHGELALRAFGAELERRTDSVSIKGGQSLQGIEAVVPGDISSAAFFLCAAALFPGSNLVLDALGLNPTRATLLDVLTALGAHIGVLNLEEKHGELIGTVQVNAPAQGLTGTTISGGLAAQLIDELPVLAAIAPYTQNGIRIRDAKELRVKESDRIALVARNLRAMGAEVEEFEDGLDVPGGQQLHGAEIHSGGDHRIAMAFSVAALRAEGETLIQGAESAAISFPEFYDLLEQIAER
ncbi:3-phosphoshikimate 1-carboxyvinyltransferase [Pseudacidobacterium ailaaui]|jgi:3-phosphoshikimate 1-carboxyvinyltransferase|uniref:3-phosphoshikimate 1-carboxyvinyltransferase n=1 Tax=Pseudacidobacterium ailaaui TaxID=1382359 RepID=UPI00047C9D57|nr:3-phosphoshikimate 1-carboxyvinyltransferase [Pseudacidobacterium ailaaui]MBX6358464.1 3-phosphoshikimate 1-carboxyvinyltransferase [Pseudacidobacterium ailaaui]